MPPAGQTYGLPKSLWSDAKAQDLDRMCRWALVNPEPPAGVLVPFLNRQISDLLLTSE
jgi:hypothetical protein